MPFFNLTYRILLYINEPIKRTKLMYEHQFINNLYANNTICPRSSDHILHSRLPYKMGSLLLGHTVKWTVQLHRLCVGRGVWLRADRWRCRRGRCCSEPWRSARPGAGPHNDWRLVRRVSYNLVWYLRIWNHFKDRVKLEVKWRVQFDFVKAFVFIDKSYKVKNFSRAEPLSRTHFIK